MISTCGCAFFALSELKSVLPPSKNSLQEAPREVIREIIKEVPVERIVERQVKVPVEVVKEVPAKIPEEYNDAMSAYRKIQAASSKSTSNLDTLEGISGFKVVIILSDAVKSLVNEDQIKTKIELSLRRNGIVINESSKWELWYVIEALAIKRADGTNTGALAFASKLRIRQPLIIPREGEWYVIRGDIYENSYYGVASESRFFLSAAADAIDDFSNKYLEKNPR